MRIGETTRVRTLASWTRRLLAGAIDLAVGALAVYALSFVGLFTFERWTDVGDLPLLEHVAVTLHGGRLSTYLQWISLWTPLVLVQATLGLFERPGAGALVTGLDLVDATGFPAPAWRRMLRALTLLLWPATLMLAPVLQAASRTQRGPQDWLSGTWMVKSPSGPRRRSARHVGPVPER